MSSLTREQIPAAIERATNAVRAWTADEIARHKAVKPDPRDTLQYVAWHRRRMSCVLVVKHRDRTGTIEVSRDGGRGTHAFINPAQILIQPESDGEFLLAIINARLAKWILEKQRVDLLGTTPDLADGTEWTAEQRETWARLSRARKTINDNIYFAENRLHRAKRRSPLLTRNDAA